MKTFIEYWIKSNNVFHCPCFENFTKVLFFGFDTNMKQAVGFVAQATVCIPCLHKNYSLLKNVQIYETFCKFTFAHLNLLFLQRFELSEQNVLDIVKVNRWKPRSVWPSGLGGEPGRLKFSFDSTLFCTTSRLFWPPIAVA